MTTLWKILVLVPALLMGQWVQSSHPVPNPHDIFFTDSLTGFITGTEFIGGIEQHWLGKTFDGGHTWELVSIDEWIRGFYQVSENVLLAYGPWSKLYRSSDSGSTWQLVFDRGYERLADIEFVNDQTGFVIIGDRFYRTDDSGIEWIEISALSGAVSESSFMHFFDDNEGWIKAAGYPNRSFIWTYDQWESWAVVSIPSLDSIAPHPPKSFISPDVGFVTVRSGDIAKTVDGGLTWSLLNRSAPNQGFAFVDEIVFLSENVGFAGGQYSTSDSDLTTRNSIYKTTDGGNSWTRIFYDGLPWPNLFSMAIVSDEDIWVLTDQYYYYSCSTSHVNDDLKVRHPTSVELTQNYPNPFNPTTTIEYKVIREERVNITIHDAKGTFVTTLVDAIQSAGDYVVKFDATDLASGVYFCTIATPNYSRSTKMILAK